MHLKFDMAALPRWLHQYQNHYCNYTLHVPRARALAHDAGRDARGRATQGAVAEHEPPLVERHARAPRTGGPCGSASRIFAASLASLGGADLVGWMARPRPWEWTDLAGAFAWSKLLAPAGAGYASWHPLVSFATTYAVFTALFAIGARSLQLDVRRFVNGFTVLFVVTWAAWIAGNELHLTMVDAAVDGRNRYRDAALSWGLQLGEGAPYLLALIAGLAIGNFAKGFAAKHLGEAARPEWYIKTAIVFLGVNLGAQTMEASGFAVELILTGAAATFVAYLFFWPIVYTARAPRVRLQARRVGRARVRHLGVRRVRGHRDGRRDSREAHHPRHGLDGRRDLRDARAHRPAGRLHGVRAGSADRQRRGARHDREDRRRRRRGRRAARRADDRAEPRSSRASSGRTAGS